jgi:hypothetical protein
MGVPDMRVLGVLVITGLITLAVLLAGVIGVVIWLLYRGVMSLVGG